MRRWLIVLLTVGGLVVAAGLVAFREAEVCDERDAAAEAELVQRANQLLDLLWTDPPNFATQTTEQFRSSPPGRDIGAYRQLVVSSLSAPRSVQEVWRATRLPFTWSRDGRERLSICEVSAPYADTVKSPAASRYTAVVFFETEQEPLAYRLTLQLSRHDKTWLADSLSVQPWRDRGRTAHHFEHLGDARINKDALGALMAYLAAGKLSVRSSTVETIEQGRIMTKLGRVLEPSERARILARATIPRDHDFLDISMEAAPEGLIPLVAFVSAQRGEATRSDAEALFQALGKASPGFATDFSAIALRAYPEPPVSGRSYETFGIVIRTATP